MTNTVTKVPAMQEDLGIGVGTIQQQRGSTTFDVTQIELNWIMRSIAEIKALSISKYTRVQLHETGATTKYWYDSTSSALPNDSSVLLPDSSPSLGRWLLITDSVSGSVPLAGTVLGKPITGPLEFLTAGTNGSITISHDNDVLGDSDAMVFRANGADTSFFFVTKTISGNNQSFGFTAAGNLVLPSVEEGNTENWAIGSAEILGKSNTLIFSAQNALGTQTAHPIAFSTAIGITFVMHEDNGGWLQLPRTTVIGDDPLSAVTKDYVDAAIPPGGGEANTMSASGAGIDITLPKAAANLPIKSIIAGTDIAITEQADTITINSTASGGVGGDFVPLSGTLPGAQISGDLIFDGSTTNCIFNGNSGVVFGATGAGLGDIYGIGYSDSLKTLLIAANQVVPPVEAVGLTFGVWTGITHNYINIQPSGRMTLGSTSIDTSTDTAVLTLGWWKDDVLNAVDVSFGGHVHAGEFSSQGNINAIGSFNSTNGQYYLHSAQGSAGNTLTRRDWVEANSVSIGGTQTITGIKTFTNTIHADGGVGIDGGNLALNGGEIFGVGDPTTPDSAVNRTWGNSQWMRLTSDQSISGLKTFSGGGIDTRGLSIRSDFINAVFYNDANGTSVGSITTNGSSTSYNTTSDYRLKNNPVVIHENWALELLKACPAKQWSWKEGGATGYGFIAHELQEVFPEAVTHDKDDPDNMQQVDYSKLVPLLWAQNQAMLARIEELENA